MEEEKQVPLQDEVKETGPELKKEEKTREQLEHHIEDLSDRLLRTMAESENIRRRYEKQIDDIKDYAIVGFAKDLISVVDNLARAIKFQPENMTPELKSVIEGVLMTHKELESILAKHGVIAIEPKEGDKFDYNLHHAISQVASETIPPESVVGLMQVGYKIKDRLLRPASVSVAKAKEQ
jgi:molecular chaperone GrpE